ncbi:unnamed protein product [Closterium sp. NIES-53]
MTSRCLTTVSFPTALPLPPPPPLFLAPGTPPVDPLSPQGPAPSGVSQVDPAEPVEVAVDSGAARGAEPAGAGTGVADPGVSVSEGAELGGAEPERVEPRGDEPGGAASGIAEPGGAEPECVEPGGAEPRVTASWDAEPERADSGGPPGVPSWREPLSPQQLHEWYVRHCCGVAGAAGAGGAAKASGGADDAGAAGGATGVGAAGGAGAAGPGGARNGGTGAARAGGATGVEAVGTGAVATGVASGAGAVGGTGAGGAEGFVARDPGAEGTGAVSAVSGGAVRPRPYYFSLLQRVLGLPPSPGPTPHLLSPAHVQGLTERHEPESRPVSPVSCPASPESRSESPHPSTAPQRVPLPSPPVSSLPDGPDLVLDSLRAASPTVTRFLATAVTDPMFESTAASALVAELVDFAAACRLDYATSLVAEHEELECFAAAVPHLVSVLLAPEGDLDAPDIPTSRYYEEAIEGPYSSQWQAAMDAEMASLKSIGTYVDEVPPPGANIVSGMWIFRVKRPPGSPPVFKARYVARDFSQRQGVDFFQTFSPTLKMTTLRVLLHVAAQRDYELHSLDFSTAFLQGSLHEEIWLRRPPGFTRSFPSGTQWSLRQPVSGLRQAPREWHDTLRTTLAALGFAPSTADPSLFLRTNTTMPPFYILVYIDDLVFATADTEALAHAKSELQKRHTCTDLGELKSYLGLWITRDRAQRTITFTQSHMVQQVLQRFGFTYSSPRSTPLPTGQSLSAPPSDESVESSGPYPELVGCLISSCEAEIYAGVMATQELRWLTYLLTDLAEAPCSPRVLYVDNKAMLALCQEHRLEHRTKHIALHYFLAQELQERGQLRLAYVAFWANTADVFTVGATLRLRGDFVIHPELALLFLAGLAPREWHDTLRTALAALGFAPSTADPLLFLHTDTTLLPLYVLVYIDDLVFATADKEALALVKAELQERHTCTDLGLVLGGQSSVVLTGHSDASWADNQTTQRSSQGYTFSLGSGSILWRSTRSSSVLGLSCEAEIYAGAMAAQELR